MVSIIYLLILVLVLVSFWKIYEKAGRQGWEAIIPIYNIYVLLQIVNKPTWWLIMFFIPLVNIVFGFLTFTELAKKFGKSTGFGVGLFLLSFVFMPMLAFSNDKFQAE